MALTPEDVRKKTFTTTRLREGYEQTEVDEFLDEVEAELTRLLEENAELRSASTGDAVATPDAATPDGVPSGTSGASGAQIRPARTPAAPQEIVVRTSGDVSAAAAKVLEMAQRTADQYLGEARSEADALVADAAATAERVSTEARTKADEVDRATHERTAALEQELGEQRRVTLSGLQDEKRRLESEIETLRSFEREYRGRLRTFLENQLDQLSSRDNGDAPLAPQGGPPPSPPVEAAQTGVSAGGTTTGDADSSDGDATDLTSAAVRTDAVSADGPSTATTAAAAAESERPAAADGSTGQTDAASAGDTRPRSALGRILEEEERKVDDRF